VMAAGHDHHILLAILLTDDGRRLAARGEHVTPDDLAGLDVDRLDHAAVRIDGDAAPVRSAVVAGIFKERSVATDRQVTSAH
jgi:hypothetical protein